jgi:hypothetical protein
MAKKKKRIAGKKKDGGLKDLMPSFPEPAPKVSEEDRVDLNFKVSRSFRTEFKREALDCDKSLKGLLEDMFKEWRRRKE